MITQDQINADAAAIASAQAALDAANKQAQADAIIFAAEQPLLSAINALVSYQVHIPPESVPSYLTAIETVKAAL